MTGQKDGRGEAREQHEHDHAGPRPSSCNVSQRYKGRHAERQRRPDAERDPRYDVGDRPFRVGEEKTPSAVTPEPTAMNGGAPRLSRAGHSWGPSSPS